MATPRQSVRHCGLAVCWSGGQLLTEHSFRLRGVLLRLLALPELHAAVSRDHDARHFQRDPLWPGPFRPTLDGGLAQNGAYIRACGKGDTCRLGELRLSTFQQRSRAGRALVRTARVLVSIGAGQADRVSKGVLGRPSSWRASRSRGLMQGPRLGDGPGFQTCRRPCDDLTAKNNQRRYHENDY
jgi:hypothetical protein